MVNKNHFFLCIVFFITIALIFTPLFSASINRNFFTNSIFNKTHSMENSDIHACLPQDDSFHGSTPFPSVEWWYFDSMFTQNYSAHIGFKIFTFQGFHLLKPSINIYKNTTLIGNETTILPQTKFSVSTQYPNINIQGKTVMWLNKSHYEKNNEWKYHLRYSLNHIGINLTFISETRGWCYQTAYEGWTVAIPKGQVEGVIYINNTKISVNGRGYHDHNWNFSLQTPARGWSWYWGKLTGESVNLAWAIIKDTGILEQTFVNKLGVLNIHQDQFIVIDPDHISFNADSYIFKNNRFIPTEFHLVAKQDDIFVNITFYSIGIHRSDPMVLTIHYWRYFVSVSGVISYKDSVEYLHNKVQIMEYMRFI